MGLVVGTVGEGVGLVVDTVGEGVGLVVDTVGVGVGLIVDTVGVGVGLVVDTVEGVVVDLGLGKLGVEIAVELAVGDGEGEDAVMAAVDGVEGFEGTTHGGAAGDNIVN